MKIVMASITPLFPDKVIGGSTKHLQNVAIYLGELGHTIVILCTKRADNKDQFYWHKNVKVIPCFHFKQPFPQPYDMGAYHFANNIQAIIEELQNADRLYFHDGEILFPPLSHNLPTIISLRDNVYPETMLGSFLFQGDALITISNYSTRSVLATAGRYISDLENRVVTINNGLDFERFKPTNPSSELLDLIQINPEEYKIILHPHRPEPSKGLQQTVEVVKLLVHHYQLSHLKVLVPQWFDSEASPEIQEYMTGILKQIQDYELEDCFIFHDWIPQRLMPEYYSLGDLTLALGHFVEAFGNVVYESLCCGTISIASRISTHRELLPDHLLAKVHFNDHETAGKIAFEVLNNKKQPSLETLNYLKEHYGIQEQLKQYAQVILETSKRSSITYQLQPLQAETKFTVAPWCYEWGESYFYHDYLTTHVQNLPLSQLLKAYPQGFTFKDGQEFAITSDQILQWYQEGYITLKWERKKD